MRKLEIIRGQYENKHMQVIDMKNLVKKEMRTHDFKSHLFMCITANKKALDRF